MDIDGEIAARKMLPSGQLCASQCPEVLDKRLRWNSLDPTISLRVNR
jgi:hypothetical protein